MFQFHGDGEVTAVDASNWGLGATCGDFNTEEVQQLGRFSERWRFESEEFRSPRTSAFGVDLAVHSDEASAVQWAAAESSAVQERPGWGLKISLSFSNKSLFQRLTVSGGL